MGAAGGAGVEATAGAGVDGAFAGVEAELDAGTAFGYKMLAFLSTPLPYGIYLLYHADNKTLLLNLVGLNGVGILENLACNLSASLCAWSKGSVADVPE